MTNFEPIYSNGVPAKFVSILKGANAVIPSPKSSVSNACAFMSTCEYSIEYESRLALSRAEANAELLPKIPTLA